MVDRLFAEPRLAELYDALCAGRPDFEFYLPLMMSAQSVLDVGCGTGALLRAAREAGHSGRLCGLDPAEAMLEHARVRDDVEWIVGDLGSASWCDEFELVVMTGHAFQVLVDDEAVRASLAAIRSALTAGGRFAFETRNPQVREWERWTPDNGVEIVDANGAVVRMEDSVDNVIDGEIVSFSVTFSSSAWEGTVVSRSTLRFLAAPSLLSFLSSAGLVVVDQFGDWHRRPLTSASPEIITVARRGSGTSTPQSRTTAARPRDSMEL